MSNLSIKVLSDININAIYFELVASGYEYSTLKKPDCVIKLCDQIKNYSGLGGNIKRYFEQARKKTNTHEWK